MWGASKPGFAPAIAIGCGAFSLIIMLITLALFGFYGKDNALVKPTGQFASGECRDALDYVKNSEYLPWVADAAQKYLKGDQAILISLIQTESNWNPTAGAGSSSAAGLGQFISGTARGYKEFTGGTVDGITWPAGKIYDNPDGKSDDARFDPKRSIYAAAHKFGEHMKQYKDDPVQAYMKGYHTYKNEEQRTYAQRGADRMMEAYNKLRQDGGCSNTTRLANATPFDCSGKKFVFPIVGTNRIDIPATHHDYSATDVFVYSGSRVVEGDPIVSVTDGTVVRLNQRDSGDGGVTVRIVDRDNISYYYAHLQVGSNSHLRVGEAVKAGDQIGRLGKTGNARSTPAHLHLGIAPNDHPQTKGYYPSQKIDPRPGTTGTFAQSNHLPLKAWKKGECADPKS